jgi:hypothetical protein
MKRRLFLVPLALALLGAVAWLRPSAEFGDAPRATAAADPVCAREEAPARATTPPPHEPPPKPVFGRLRVVIEGDAVPGRLLVFGARERLDVNRAVPAGSEILSERLPAGPKHVVFLPSGGRLAASAAADVPPSGVAEARLALAPSATLEGSVVDVLQRPLPGVRLAIRRPPLFAPRPRPPGAGSLFIGEESAGRGAEAVVRSTSLEADGALRLGATSGADGAFALEGVALGTFDVEVSWKEIRFLQACTVGAENRIVVPGVPEADVVDPAETDARERITAWLRQMALHPEAPEPRAAPLRAFLRERLAAKPLTPRERADLEARIDSIGRAAR